MVAVKAIACELPATLGLPLSRLTRAELHRLVIERGVTDASASTIWRWLHEDAIKPWQQRSWLFVRDPDFRAKAGQVLDLSHPGNCGGSETWPLWVGRRRIHPMPAPRKYPDELRERAIREVFASGRPIAHVARDLGIHREALRAWVRQAEADRAPRPTRVLPADVAEELKALRKENAELRRANAILKDASVYFAQELDPTRRR